MLSFGSKIRVIGITIPKVIVGFDVSKCPAISGKKHSYALCGVINVEGDFVLLYFFVLKNIYLGLKLKHNFSQAGFHLGYIGVGGGRGGRERYSAHIFVLPMPTPH